MILQGCASNQPQAQPPQQSPAQPSSSQTQAGSNSASKSADSGSGESRPAGEPMPKAVPANAARASSDHLRSREQAGVDTHMRFKGRAGAGRRVNQAVTAGKRESQGTIPAAGRQSARGQTSREHLAHLERALDHSLADFDGRLLREREKLNQTRAGDPAGATMTGGSGQFTEPNAATMSSNGSASGSGNRPEGPVATIGGDVSKGSPSGTVPAGIPDGHDDDVVARQLREAAESETDPVLRKKLWQEYKDYKNGTASQRR